MTTLVGSDIAGSGEPASGVERLIRLTAPMMGTLSADIPVRARQVLILLAQGCTGRQTAKITGYSEDRVSQLRIQYREVLAALAVQRDLVCIGVLEAVQGMIGERLGEAVEGLDLSKPSSGDVVKLASALEIVRRAAYDVRASSHDPARPSQGRPSERTLADLDTALARAKAVQAESSPPKP